MPASVLVQPSDDPHHVHEAPSVAADAYRRRGYLDALRVGDYDLQTRLAESDGVVPPLTHPVALGTAHSMPRSVLDDAFDFASCLLL